MTSVTLPPALRRGRLLARMALLLVATFAAYWPVVRAGFIWDDDGHVTRPDLRSLAGLRRIWLELNATQQYYPVLHSAFWVEYRLWADSALGYHLLNILLHGCSAVLFALVLIRLFQIDPETSGPRVSHGPDATALAWLAAAMFALHPVAVESVAWISEQKNTLSTVFYLCSALLYLRFDRTRSRPFYAAALGLYVLALLTKSVTASLPAALLVVLWWRRGRLGWQRDLGWLVPWLALGATAGLTTAWFERRFIGAQGAEFNLTFAGRLLVAGRAAWFYLGKIIWPRPLIFIYPRWTVDPGQLSQWIFPVGMAAGLFLLVWARRRRGPLAAALFFLGTLFPALGFINVYPFIYSYVADHFQYLASLGIFALVAAGGVLLWRRAPAAWRPSLAGGAALGLVGLGVLTARQAAHYRDLEGLYRITLAQNPGAWMAHNNLGLILQADGREAEAIGQFEEALRLNSEQAEIHNNLGVVLGQLGRFDEALREYRAALTLNPRYFTAFSNLGQAYYQTGRRSEAVAAYQAALQLKPDYVAAHYNLGIALLDSGQPAPAIRELERAAGAEQHRAEIHLYLGEALADLQRTGEAAREYAQAEKLLKPGEGAGWFSLGNGMNRLGRPAAASAAFAAAAKAEPNNPDFAFALGNALAADGGYAAAAAAYRRVLALAPKRVEARNNLGNALLLEGQVAQAIAEYREALRQRPGDPALVESLQRALDVQAGGAAAR